MSGFILNSPRFNEQLICWPAGNFSSTTSTYYSTSGLEIDFGVQASGVSAIPPNQRVRFQSSLGGRANTVVIVSDFGATTSVPVAGAVTASWGAPACFNAATETLEWWVEVDCGDSVLPSANVIATTSGTVQQTTIDHATAGQQCAAPPAQNYYDATDCYDGSAQVIQTPNALSVGDVIEYDVSTGYPYKCAEITGVSSCTSASCSTASQATSNVYASCCAGNEANSCRALSGFSTPTNGSSSAYNSSGYLQTVEFNLTPSPSSPSQWVINEHTKVSIEAKLGGRSATTVVASDFGTSTSTYLWGGVNVQHNYDGSGCFNSASETLEWRLKVECGSWNGTGYVNCSTDFGAWQSASIDHATASQQCSGGSNFVVTDCNTGATSIIDDSLGYGPPSVGDFVDWDDNSGNGPFCGEITASSSGAAVGWFNGGTYTDCVDCNTSNYLQIHQVTDCSDSSTHLVQDQSGYGLSVGDFIEFYDSSNTHRCGTVTALNQTGNANGAYVSGSGYSDCAGCYQSAGISNPYLYTATDCNNPSTTYILGDTQYNNYPSTGDVHVAYLNASGNYVCVTVTGTTSSGTSVGYLDSSETDCASCLSNSGLAQHEVEDCNTGATHIVTDSASLVYSVGDVISYYDLSYVNVYCGTVTAMNVSGTAGFETSSGYTDCAECNSYEGL